MESFVTTHSFERERQRQKNAATFGPHPVRAAARSARLGFGVLREDRARDGAVAPSGETACGIFAALDFQPGMLRKERLHFGTKRRPKIGSVRSFLHRSDFRQLRQEGVNRCGDYTEQVF